jgi:hypothetical protein
MRAEVDLNELPIGLVGALLIYDGIRLAHKDLYVADNYARSFKATPLERLYDGLSKTSSRGIAAIAKNAGTGICLQYIKERNWDLMQLFYWSGDDEFIKRLLINAWKKGKV